ncbi:putative efflux pump antibiotic resistance protein [Xylariales sp. PMI_506]|nr:putative efflux pump antibiotic resistance protein [Xylariales sp. PMI_506]
MLEDRRYEVGAVGDVEKPAQSPNPPGDESEENFKPKTLKFWSILISIFLTLFIVALDRTIITTAIPKITAEFQSLGDIGWYGSAYQLTTSAMQLVFGRIYKFYDTKLVFLASLAVFEAGSAICGAAPNSTVFIVGRAIAGLGGSGLFSGTMILMIPMVPLRKRPMFQGLFGMIMGVSSVAGPLIGGAFTDAVSWRWCFYVNLPIGAAVAIGLILVLKTPAKPSEPVSIWEHIKRLDPLGTFFFVPSIVSLLLALEWGGSIYPWGSTQIIVLLVVFGVLWLAFMAVQILNPKRATVPPKVITQRSIFCGAIFMLALSGAMLMAIYYLPLWFQVVQGVSAVRSGIYTIPFVLSMVVGSILAGGITQKIGYYVPAMIICPSLMAVGQGLMSTFTVDEDSAHWIGYQVIAGFGLGMGMQTTGLAAQAVLPKPDIPTGIAIMFFAQQLGGAIFVSVGQNILTNLLSSQLSGIPGFDTSSISTQGAGDIVSLVPAEDRQTVLVAYNYSITRIFLVGLGVSIVSVVAALGMEWKNLKKTGPHAPPPAPAPVQRSHPPVQQVIEEPSDISTDEYFDASAEYLTEKPREKRYSS